MLNLGVSLVQTAREVPTWVMASPEAPISNVSVLEGNGVRVFRPETLAQAFAQLRLAGIQSLLCEGGGALGTKLLAEGLVDRLYWVQAPVCSVTGECPLSQAFRHFRSPTRRAGSLWSGARWALIHYWSWIDGYVYRNRKRGRADRIRFPEWGKGDGGRGEG